MTPVQNKHVDKLDEEKFQIIEARDFLGKDVFRRYAEN